MEQIRAALTRRKEALGHLSPDNQESLFKRGENAYDQKLLSATLSLLDDLTRLKKAGLYESLERLTEDMVLQLEELETRGLWGKSSEEQELIMKFRQEVHGLRPPVRFSLDLAGSKIGSEEKEGTPNISIVEPPPAQPTPLRSSRREICGFSDDEVAIEDELNEVFFFHALATAPEEIIPPGQNLRSVITRSGGRLDDGGSSNDRLGTKKIPTLQQKVTEIVHKAFWDEALTKLSDPAPSVQLSRLRGLYFDLHAALVDVIPVNHTVMITLSSPLSPTSSPLVSAIRHLKEVAVELRRRCAPIRDEALDDVIRRLDEPGRPQERPQKIVDAVKELLHLAELMQDDIAAISLIGVSDADLAEEITRVARTRERRAILQLWGLEQVKASWNRWLDQVDVAQAYLSGPNYQKEHKEMKWVRRLLQSLATDLPVSCKLPHGITKLRTTVDWALGPGASAEVLDKFSANSLPPIFFFWTGQLVHIQNLMQAVISAAGLRSLVPVSRTSASHAGSEETSLDKEPTFMERVWMLYEIELAGDGEQTGSSKLVNFADEVVREWRRIHSSKATTLDSTSQSTGFSKSDEDRLRAAVDRVMRSDDPVFLLLKRRLLEAIWTAITRANSELKVFNHTSFPKVMQTGRNRARINRSQWSPSSRQLAISGLPGTHAGMGDHAVFSQVEAVVVKGFEEHVLRKAVVELIFEVGAVVEWMRDLWKDTLEGLT